VREEYDLGRIRSYNTLRSHGHCLATGIDDSHIGRNFGVKFVSKLSQVKAICSVCTKVPEVVNLEKSLQVDQEDLHTKKSLLRHIAHLFWYMVRFSKTVYYYITGSKNSCLKEKGGSMKKTHLWFQLTCRSLFIRNSLYL